MPIQDFLKIHPVVAEAQSGEPAIRLSNNAIRGAKINITWLFLPGPEPQSLFMLVRCFATHVQSTEWIRDGKEGEEVVCLWEPGRKNKSSIGSWEKETKMKKKKNT